MGCELDKVVEAINKVASEVRDSRAINQLNELKSNLNKFATSMETAKHDRDFSKLRGVMSSIEVKATAESRPEFDKLPSYNEGQKTMTYAGIGSRETPIDIQKEMYRIGKELESLGYTGQSGGATGADKAFEGANQPWEKEDGTVAGTKEFTKSKANVTRWAQYGKGKNSPTNMVVFKATDSNDTVRKIAKEIHPKKQNLSEKDGLDLHARNTFQVFGKNLDTPVDFVLFYAEEQKGLIRPKGGTGQAVEMARLKGIPTINMANSGWKEQLDKVLDSIKKSGSRKVPEATNNDNTINIYSVDNNGYSSLSNFNAGPITINGKEFPTLEHAFQYWKASKASKNGLKESNQKRIMSATSGFNAQKEGNTIPIDTNIWTETESTRALETIMRRYYSSNEDAKKLLLSTGDKVITHIGKNNRELDNRFPKILMKIREELRDTKPTVETDYGTNEETISTDVEADIEVSKLVESKHLSRYKNNSNIAKSIEKIIDAYDTAEFSNVVTTRDGEAKRRALWFGEEVYKYSGKSHEATMMHPYVIKIARDIEKETGMPVGYFNSVLINEYKGGKGLKAHRDNESIFIDKDNNIGEIASLTLSGEGKVTIYDNKGKEVESHKVNSGDLYVMPGKQFQNNFRHKVDTIGKDTRISLTFRHIPNKDITTEVQSKEEVQLPEAKEGLTRGQTKSKKKDAIIAPINSQTAKDVQGCNK